MLNIKVGEVPILAAAQRRNLGESTLEKIAVDGDYNTIPKLENFKLSKSFRSTKKRNNQAVFKVIDFFKTRPKVNRKKCKNCNVCAESCPVAAIDIETKQIDYGKCIECMCCHELCMHQAIDLKKENFLARIVSSLYRG